jgi:hypothetical protein
MSIYIYIFFCLGIVEDVKKRICFEDVLKDMKLQLTSLSAASTPRNHKGVKVEEVYDSRNGILGINRDVWIHVIYFLHNLWSGRIMLGIAEEFYKLILIPQFIDACEGSLLFLS